NAGGTTAVNAASIRTSGAQTYNDAVTLGGAGAIRTFASTTNGNITFASTLDGGKNLIVNTGGTTSFGGAVGGTTRLTSVTTDATGTTAINGASINTTGAQSFGDDVTLGGAGTKTLDSNGNGN